MRPKGRIGNQWGYPTRTEYGVLMYANTSDAPLEREIQNTRMITI